MEGAATAAAPVGRTRVVHADLRMDMKRLIPAIVIVAVVVGIGAWLLINLRARQHYARLRDEVVQESCSIKAMDEGTQALLKKARAEWREVHSQVGGPFSESLGLLGLRPCVASVVELCAYRPPEYSFMSPHANERAVLMGISQLLMFGPASDRSLYVSDDRHLAVMRCGMSSVYVFSDAEGGLRATLYGQKANGAEPEKKAQADAQGRPPGD
jgi:hypothetical protein